MEWDLSRKNRLITKFLEAFAAACSRYTIVQLALSHLDNVRMQITGDLIRCVSSTRHGMRPSFAQVVCKEVDIGTSGRNRVEGAIVCVPSRPRNHM